jgi:hypothetical protein
MKTKFLLALLLLMFLATAAVSSDTPRSASKDTADQCDQQETIVAGIPSLDDQVEVNTETVVEKEVAAVCEVEIAVSLASHDDNVNFENYNANRNSDLTELLSAEYTTAAQRSMPLKWSTSTAAGRLSA